MEFIDKSKFYSKWNRSTFFRSLGIIVLSGLLLSGFQNCSNGASLSSQKISQSQAQNSLDNGTPYDGKPNDRYSRWMPGFSCSGQPEAAARIEIRNGAFFHVENSALQCDWRTREIDSQEIDRSTFQSSLWGYQDGIFEADDPSAAMASSLPANLVEVWCNDSRNEKQSEVIVYYDEAQKKGKVRLFEKNDNVVTEQEILKPARLVTSNSVFVTSAGDDFDLVVHRDQRDNMNLGLFAAEVRFRISGVEKRYATSCRLGGLLDSRLWPAKQIIDVDVSDIVEAPNKNDFVYNYSRNDGTWALGWGSVQLGRTEPIPVAFKAKGVSYVDFTDDSKSLVFVSDLSFDYVSELFMASLSGLRSGLETPRRLSAPLVQPNQSVDPDVKLIRGGQVVLYRDGSQELTDDVEPWLRSVSLVTGEIAQLNPRFTGADEEVQNFTYSLPLRRSVFLGGFTRPRLYSVNSNGADLVDETPTLEKNEFLRYGQKLNLFGNGSLVKVSTIFYYSSDTRDVVLNLKTRLSIPLLKNHDLEIFDEGVNRAILVNNRTKDLVFFDGIRRTSKPISKLELLDVNGKASVGGKLVLAATKVGVGSPGKTALRALNVSKFSETPVCENLNGDQILVDTSADTSGWVIASIDQVNKVAQIAELDSALNCRIINSVNLVGMNLETEVVQTFVLSPDFKQALLAIGSRRQIFVSDKIDRLYYAPLDGRAPLQVNAGLTDSGKISHFQWSADSKSIFFFGSYRNETETRGYLWRLPECQDCKK